MLNNLLLALDEVSFKGTDEYCSLECEYPEVYAKVSIGLFYKWKMSQEEKYKDKAKLLLNRMSELAIKSDETACWGLPFDWGDTRKDDGFLITTCFCIQALNLWNFKQTQKLKEQAINWCFTLVKENIDSADVDIFYSPKLKINIYNATSLACGTLLECNELSKKQLDILYRAVKTLIFKQKKEGYWNYSSEKDDVDTLHQSYTVEGLIRCYPHIEEQALKKALLKTIRRGEKFLVFKLWTQKETERYLFSLTNNEKKSVKLKHLFLKIFRWLNIGRKHFPEKRCWSYAAYLRVQYYYAQNIEQIYSCEIKECLKKITAELFCNTYMKYTKNNNKNFIRHQAHMIEGLAYVENYES